MIAILLILLIAMINFGLGFCLAVHLGHGPPWFHLPSPNALRRSLQARSADSKHRAH